MCRRFRLVGLAVALIALSSASCSRQKQAQSNNPWAQFGTGSWVMMRTVQTMTVQGEQTVNEREEKLELVEVTADRLVFERTLTQAGGGGSERLEMPRFEPVVATGKVPAATHPAVASAIAAAQELEVLAAEGEEVLEIAGRQVPTRWAKYGTGPSTKKVWKSPEVPGPFCKTEMRIELGGITQELTVEVTAFEKK